MSRNDSNAATPTGFGKPVEQTSKRWFNVLERRQARLCHQTARESKKDEQGLLGRASVARGRLADHAEPCHERVLIRAIRRRYHCGVRILRLSARAEKPCRGLFLSERKRSVPGPRLYWQSGGQGVPVHAAAPSTRGVSPFDQTPEPMSARCAGRVDLSVPTSGRAPVQNNR